MTVPEDDRGLLLGDGLFETLLARGGAPLDWDAHWRRLVEGCRMLGLPAPDRHAAVQAAGAAAAAAAAPEAAVRLTWTAGSGGRGLDRPAEARPRLLVRADAYVRPAGPARLATVSVRRNEGSPASRLKTLSAADAVVARAEALAAGADEALMLNNCGEVACAAAANLFWLDGDRLLTPALACGVLAGVTRAKILAAAPGVGLAAAEVHAPHGALQAASSLLLSNSLIGVRQVAMLDGRPLRLDEPRLAALIAAVSRR